MTALAQPMRLPPGRTPPQDLDAERCVLGGALLDPASFDEVVDHVAAADFYREAHRKIFEAMISVTSRNEPIERVTVKAELRRMGALEAVGGEEFVDVLDTVVPGATNIAWYAKLVREAAQKRRLIEAGHAIATAGYENEQTAPELLDDAERRVMAVREGLRTGCEVVPLRQLIKAEFVDLEARHARQEEVTGVPSGIAELDRMTAGFQPGEGWFLAARPSKGKSTLGMNIADHVAGVEQPEGKRRAVSVFSMEMPRAQLVQRLICARARVDMARYRVGKLVDSDWAKVAKAAGELAEAPLDLDDTRALTALELRARARRYARKWKQTATPLGLVVVDYLTLMAEDPSCDTKTEAVGKNARMLRELAGELGVPVLCLAQLNRAPAKGGAVRRPVLTDLRDSGEIEQHADGVLFLHHEGDEERPKTVEILLDKQRNGAVGSVTASHLWPFCLIESLSKHDVRASAQRDWTESVPHTAEST